jgi:hypothetical protein
MGGGGQFDSKECILLVIVPKDRALKSKMLYRMEGCAGNFTEIS